MRKLIWFLLFIIIALAVCCIYFAVPAFKSGINQKVLGPLSIIAGNTANNIYASSFWKSYIVPNQFIIGGVSGGLVVVLFLWLVKPKLPAIRHKVPTTPSGLGTSAGVRVQTPVGATVRPLKGTNPEVPEEILESETVKEPGVKA